MTHPCLPCGACCAHQRVRFSSSQLASRGGVVPDDTVRRMPDGQVAMAGTLGLEPRCHQLRGTVGNDTHCAIYESRPDECRAFQPSWLHGVDNPYCDAARIAHGLSPLSPEEIPPDAQPWASNRPLKASAAGGRRSSPR